MTEQEIAQVYTEWSKERRPKSRGIKKSEILEARR
jgi:hypothetical protein